MSESADIEPLLSSVKEYEEGLHGLREMFLANVVMCGEIPAPTFSEEKLVRFICDRFTEGKLHNISPDEVGNASGILPGTEGKRNIVVAAHADRIWDKSVDHTITVSSDRISGPGVADNSLGVAALVSLPDIIERLGIEFRQNLVFLAPVRSMGRGDLEGLRFFLENTKVPVHQALCLEGVQLGRLSYTCLGMIRGEIVVETAEQRDWTSWSATGAIVSMTRIIQRILAIEVPQEPKTSIILGSVRAGSAFNRPPNRATLRFEIRSEEPGMVARISDRIGEIVEEIQAERRADASYSIIARRRPGGIDFSHPLVSSARRIMKELKIDPKIAPSTSELSAFVDRNIPALTLGITQGENKHETKESIEIDPIFKGVAQILGVLKAMDEGVTDEQD